MTTVWPYLGLMCLLVAEASVLARLPFFKEENRLLESNRGYSKPLEGLRGILAFSVLAHHALVAYTYRSTGVWKPPQSHFYAQIGVIAVLMFFFMTAYLFWSKLLKQPRLAAFKFYYERLRRLWPAYLFATTLLFVSVALMSGGILKVPIARLSCETLSWIVFTIPGQPPINTIPGEALLSIVWTLRYEWLFYLSLPFLTWFARKRWFGLLCLVCVVMICRIVVATVLTNPAETADTNQTLLAGLFAIRYFLYLVAVGFLGGMIVALISPNPVLLRLARGPSGLAATAISLGFILFSARPVYGIRESAGLLIPFACIVWGNTWCGLLSCTPVRFLGRVSYSAYLLHLLVINAIYSLISKTRGMVCLSPSTYGYCLGGIGTVVLLISVFSYRYFESPFLPPKRFSNALNGVGQQCMEDGLSP